jgi:hypothetical protein
MAQMKGCNQIRKSSSIKGFRSCRHSTAVPMAILDRGRMQAGEDRRTWNGVRQIWLKGGAGASGRFQAT